MNQFCSTVLNLFLTLTTLAGTGCQVLDQSRFREPNVEMIPWNTPLDYNDWDDPATPGSWAMITHAVLGLLSFATVVANDDEKTEPATD